jgi:hypothetical protein
VSQVQERGCPQNEQAVGWVLHALEPVEELDVLRHLPRCASCRQVVAETESVLAALGTAVEQVEPPASLRGSLLARVAETPQSTSSPRPTISPDVADRPPARPIPLRPPAAPQPPKSVPAAAGGGWWRSTHGRRLIAASVALLGALAVGGLVFGSTQLGQEPGTAQAQSLPEIVNQLDQPGTSHAMLVPTDQPAGPAVAAVLVHDGQRTVVTDGLPANPTDHVYVVWGLGSGEPAPIATFDVAGTSAEVKPLGSASGAERFSGYAISLEPGRTAPASPTTVVASGQVAI